MRAALRQAIPSMYVRRLVLLAVLPVLGAGLLSLRLSYLAVIRHGELRSEADSYLVARSWIPTTRGRILDRKGRVLAVDRPAFSAAIDYDVLSGAWAAETAAKLAGEVVGPRWRSMSDPEREHVAAALEQALTRHAESSWRRLAILAGQDEDAVAARARATVARVERAHTTLVERRLSAAVAELDAAGVPVTDDRMASIRRKATEPIAEQIQAHVILADLPDTLGFELIRLAEARVHIGVRGFSSAATVPLVPGLDVRDATTREYPYADVAIPIDRATLPSPMRAEAPSEVTVRAPALQLLGRVRDSVYAEDRAARERALATDPVMATRALTDSGIDRGAYRPGPERVGSTGLEAAREHQLRGLRGLRERRRDTGDVTELPRESGSDVSLSIDVMLQARVEAAISPDLGLTVTQDWHRGDHAPVGSALASAAVVVDVDSGEVLAMASWPAPDESGEAPPEAGPLDPYVNRAIGTRYPPGSIAKALMLPEAVTRGDYQLGQGVVCTGHFLPGRNDLYRCWIYKRYNRFHAPGVSSVPEVPIDPLLGDEALKVSCNIFFFTMGDVLGPEGVTNAYERFHVGAPFDLGVGIEWPGSINEGRPISRGDARQMAIGQGPVDWTPMHAAAAYAALARGEWIDPVVVTSDARPPQPIELGLDPAALSQTMRGLELSLNHPDGTGHDFPVDGVGSEDIITVPGVRTFGKTGTATAPPLLADPDGDGPEPSQVVRTGDHAWYVLVVESDRGGPAYAIAVIVEHSGSGGTAAGPVANQVIAALKAEGYLEGNPTSRRPLAAGATR